MQEAKNLLPYVLLVAVYRGFSAITTVEETNNP
jgi:hypothetical protein